MQNVSLPALSDALCRAYGFDHLTLESIPGRSRARSFAVDAGESRYFLKVWPHAPGGRREAALQPLVLPLLQALARAGFPAAVPPLPGLDGELLHDAGGCPFALFPYIPGEAAPARLTPDLARTLGEALAGLHAATAAVRLHVPPSDPYDLAFLPRLRYGMVRLRASNLHGRPQIGSLRSPLLQREEVVEREIARLLDLYARVRDLPSERVLCHRDLGGPNIRVRPGGGVAFVDWDDAGLAPAEHGLQFAHADPEFPVLLDAYWSAGGTRALRVEQAAFFLARRSLVEVTGRLLHALDDNPSSDPGTMVMFGLDAYRCDDWETFDARMERLEAAFAGRR